MNSIETIAEVHEVNDGVSGHLATVLYFRILVCSIGNGVLGLRFKFHQNRSIFAKLWQWFDLIGFLTAHRHKKVISARNTV